MISYVLYNKIVSKIILDTKSVRAIRTSIHCHHACKNFDNRLTGLYTNFLKLKSKACDYISDSLHAILAGILCYIQKDFVALIMSLLKTSSELLIVPSMPNTHFFASQHYHRY